MTLPKKTIRVLIADDHEIMREGLRRLLDDEPDIEVVADAADGREALRLASEHRPSMVLMDIGMPNLNGIDATRQILAEVPGVRVLCLSMHKEKKIIGAMLRAGASGYLVKDSASDELVEAVRTVAGGRTYISLAVAGEVVEGFIRNPVEKANGAFASLTDREREVLQLIAEGLTSKEIAGRLNLSQKTVLAHRLHVTEKLGLRSDAELTRYALREGLTQL